MTITGKWACMGVGVSGRGSVLLCVEFGRKSVIYE